MIYTDGIHLVGDNTRELHVFAQSVGLKRSWFQKHPRHSHYDITTNRMLGKILGTNRVIIVSTRRLLEVRRPLKEEKMRIVDFTARIKIGTRVWGRLALKPRFGKRIMDRFQRVV